MKIGNTVLMTGASISNLRGQPLAADPELLSFTADHAGVTWFNTTERVYKYFDGEAIQVNSKAGDVPAGGLLRDGTVAMTADLTLASADQSLSADTAAVSKGHVAAVVAAATNVGISSVVVSDGLGKLAASTVTLAELGYLTGTTSAVQTQLDAKQASLGFVPFNKAGDTLAGDINAGGFKISDLGAPVTGTDAARKIDIENAISGMNWLADVKAVQTDALTDPGIAVKGDRYVIKDAAALHLGFGTIAGIVNNVIVEHDGTGFVVVFDPAGLEAAGGIAWSAAQEYYIRFDGTAWTEFGGVSSAVAGDGMAKAGNVFSVRQGDAIGLNLAGDLSVKVAADRGLAVNGLNELDVVLDGSTLAVGATGLSVSKVGLQAAGFLADVGGNTDHINLTAVAIPAGAEFDGYAVSRKLLETSIETATATAGQVYLYDKTALEDIAATVHTFVHNAGSKLGTVTVYDSAGYQIIPDEVILVDDNTLRVELTTALKIAIAFVALKVVPAPAPIV